MLSKPPQPHQFFLKERVRHAQQKKDIRAGADEDVFIRGLRRIGAPGIDHDSCGSTAQSTPCGVCFGPITMTVRGMRSRLRTPAAIAPEYSRPA